MSNKLFVYPYKLASNSAKVLARSLGTKRIRSAGRYYHRRGHLIINWGNSTIPQWGTPVALENTLNKPQNVAIASDKVQTFRRLEATPDWTTRIEEARGWFQRPKFRGKLNAVVCRTLTRANSGRGIVLAKTPEEVVPAPLYTRYTPKTHEYRVHVSSRFGVVDAAEKRRRNGFEELENHNQYIRSWDNGWVFCRGDLQLPDNVVQVSTEALAHVGLDFGAVDVGYHPDFGTVVYEINTAPGLEGQTLTNYTNLFRRYLARA